MDQGSGSITLSFASTAKSAPPAMQYGGTGVQPAKSLYELHQHQLMQVGVQLAKSLYELHQQQLMQVGSLIFISSIF